MRTILPLYKITQAKEYGYERYYNKFIYAYQQYIKCREFKNYKDAIYYFKFCKHYYWILYSGRGFYKLRGMK